MHRSWSTAMIMQQGKHAVAIVGKNILLAFPNDKAYIDSALQRSSSH